jgi:hypothetical protein
MCKELIGRQILNTACKRKAEKDFHNKPKKKFMEEICKTPEVNTNIIKFKE